MFKNKEYILAIYKEGGFTRAAEKLFISQPSLSATVHRLEERLGAPIFDRSTNPISLTDVGREYVTHALEITEREGDLERYVSDHAALLTGRIRIGGSSFFSSFILPTLISEFKMEYPSIIFEIQEDNTKNLLERLNIGDVDIVIDNAIEAGDRILATEYTLDKILLAVPRALGIPDEVAGFGSTADEVKAGENNKAGISLSAFRSLPFVLLTPENDTGARADKMLRRCGVAATVLFRLEQQVTAYNISATGLGVSFVSQTLVRRSESIKDMLYFNIDDELANRSICFYSRKNGYSSHALTSFIEYHTK